MSRQDLEDIKWLIKFHSSVNQPSNDGATPFSTAILPENLNILPLLIRKGANPNSTYPLYTEDGAELQMSPLVEALEMKNSAITFFNTLHVMPNCSPDEYIIHLMYSTFLVLAANIKALFPRESLQLVQRQSIIAPASNSLGLFLF